MPVRAVILDRDGTLFNEGTRQLHPGVTDMLAKFTTLGIKAFVVSNEMRDKAVEQLIGLPGSRFLYHSDCGNKGSKRYVAKVLELSGCAANEVVYLGDSEQDMWEASSNRVALFNAEWSQPDYRYGVPEPDPSEFAQDVETYFVKDNPWYFRVDGTDALGRPVMFRALLDPDTSKLNGVTALLKNRNEDFANNEAESRQATHLVLHLLGSIYGEGLHLNRSPNKTGGFMKPLWCLYPGSTGGISPVLRLFERFAGRLLTMEFMGDLLQRHTDAPSSHKARMGNGPTPSISTQFSTVQVNPERVRRVKGNVVFVVDDFSTGSNAMETARNLLYAAGAALVIGISVGKYGQGYVAYRPAAGILLPKKGGPISIETGDLVAQPMSVVKNVAALDHF